MRNLFVAFVTAVVFGLSLPSASIAVETFTFNGTWEISRHSDVITFTMTSTADEPLRDGDVRISVIKFTGGVHGFVPGETVSGRIKDDETTLRVDSLAGHGFTGEIDGNKISGRFCGLIFQANEVSLRA